MNCKLLLTVAAALAALSCINIIVVAYQRAFCQRSGSVVRFCVPRPPAP